MKGELMVWVQEHRSNRLAVIDGPDKVTSRLLTSGQWRWWIERRRAIRSWKLSLLVFRQCPHLTQVFAYVVCWFICIFDVTGPHKESRYHLPVQFMSFSCFIFPGTVDGVSLMPWQNSEQDDSTDISYFPLVLYPLTFNIPTAQLRASDFWKTF